MNRSHGVQPVQRRLTEHLRNAVQLIDVAVAGEERLAAHHLRVEAADRPDVDRPAVSGIADEELGRAIPSRRHVIGAGLVRSGDVAREAKVAELDHAVRRHQYVLGLYIAVHDLREERSYLSETSDKDSKKPNEKIRRNVR